MYFTHGGTFRSIPRIGYSFRCPERERIPNSGYLSRFPADETVMQLSVGVDQKSFGPPVIPCSSTPQTEMLTSSRLKRSMPSASGAGGPRNSVSRREPVCSSCPPDQGALRSITPGHVERHRPLRRRGSEPAASCGYV